MRAYVTSVGEKTTDICVTQLKKFGFDVVLLDHKEKWIEKYKRFINIADEDCIRVDADIILNSNIIDPLKYTQGLSNWLMCQFKVYDIYKNNIHLGIPVMYKKEALGIIRRNFDKVNPLRPEATAWRIPEINPHTFNIDEVVGIHGIYQDADTVRRAMKNKIDRKQFSDYDFELIEKLMNL